MKKLVRILVIGHGSIGERHARLSRGLSYDVAVVSKQDNLPYATFRSITEAVNSFKPESVIIATETTDHFRCISELEQCVDGLSVLVEKPLFEREIVFESPKNEYFVAYNLRFHPVFKKVRDEIRNERVVFGHITCGSFLPYWRPGRDYRQSYSSSSQRGGGVLNDLSHEFDCAMQWFGSNQLLYSHCGRSGTLEVESEDHASAILTNISGSKIFIHLDYLSRIPFRRGVIQCESKTIQYDFLEMKVHVSGKSMEYFECDSDYTYIEQLKALRGNRDLLCGLDAGREVISVVSEIRNAQIKS